MEPGAFSVSLAVRNIGAFMVPDPDGDVILVDQHV